MSQHQLTPLVQLNDAISAASNAISDVQTNTDPTVPIQPQLDPSKNPDATIPPSASLPAAACFGAGSHGFLKLGDQVIIQEDLSPDPATMLDLGSKTFFGLQLGPNTLKLNPIGGCNAVYAVLEDTSASKPQFQVDCSSNALGIYWNENRLTCYYYTDPEMSNGYIPVHFVCGNSASSTYSCLQGQGIYSNLMPAYLTWATSV